MKLNTKHLVVGLALASCMVVAGLVSWNHNRHLNTFTKVATPYNK